MRTVRLLVAGVATTAAALSVLGLTATAQALAAGPVAKISDPSVPLGIETAVNLPGCPTGTTVTSVTPTPPNTINVVLNANKVKLAGDWLATGSTTFTVHCSNGSTTKTKVTVSAAPPENAATGVGRMVLRLASASSPPSSRPATASSSALCRPPDYADVAGEAAGGGRAGGVRVGIIRALRARR